MALTKRDLQLIDDKIGNALAGFEERFEKKIDFKFDNKFDEFFKKIMSVLVHFPTRDELYANFATKQDLREVKDDINDVKHDIAVLTEKVELGTTLMRNQVDINTVNIKRNTFDIQVLQKQVKKLHQSQS